MSLTTLTASIDILFEQHRRGGIPKMPYTCGPSQALIDASYCLDAPSEIPAGSCYNFDIGNGEWVPSETFIFRSE